MEKLSLKYLITEKIVFSDDCSLFWANNFVGSSKSLSLFLNCRKSKLKSSKSAVFMTDPEKCSRRRSILIPGRHPETIRVPLYLDSTILLISSIEISSVRLTNAHVSRMITSAAAASAVINQPLEVKKFSISLTSTTRLQQQPSVNLRKTLP